MLGETINIHGIDKGIKKICPSIKKGQINLSYFLKKLLPLFGRKILMGHYFFDLKNMPFCMSRQKEDYLIGIYGAKW